LFKDEEEEEEKEEEESSAVQTPAQIFFRCPGPFSPDQSTPTTRCNPPSAILPSSISGTFSARQPLISKEGKPMLNLLLFCLLIVICWPLALAALLLYPLIWLILLPFRLVGIVVGGTFELIAALFRLPARVLRSV
jgi:hypothetical protein